MPYWDQWRLVPLYQRWLEGTLTLRNLTAQHNEHRIILTRLLGIADFAWFRGRGDLLYVVILISHLALGTLLASLACRSCKDSAERAMLLAGALAFMLAPVQLEDISWAFLPMFVHVNLFAAMSFWAIVEMSDPARTVGRTYLALLAVASTVLGICSGSGGLLAAVMAVALAFLVPVGARMRLLMTATTMISIGAYLWGYQLPSHHVAYRATLTSLDGIIRYSEFVLAYLGSIAEYCGLRVSIAVGSVGLVAWFALAGRLLNRWIRHREIDRPELTLAVIAAFVVATAMLTGLGRAGFGVSYALSTRYVSSTVVFWTALLGAWWREAPVVGATQRPLRMAVGVTSVTLMTLGYLAWYTVGPQMVARATQIDLLTAEWRAGVFDAARVAYVFPRPDEIRPLVEFLRVRKLSIFAQ